MKIQATNYFTLLTKGRPQEGTLTLPEGTTAREAINLIGIPAEEDIMIMINERPSNEHTELKEGDQLTIMPPVSAA